MRSDQPIKHVFHNDEYTCDQEARNISSVSKFLKSRGTDTTTILLHSQSPSMLLTIVDLKHWLNIPGVYDNILIKLGKDHVWLLKS